MLIYACVDLKEAFDSTDVINETAACVNEWGREGSDLCLWQECKHCRGLNLSPQKHK